MDLYFKLKTFEEYIFPAIIIGLWFLLLGMSHIIKVENRKTRQKIRKLLQKNGFERYSYYTSEDKHEYDKRYAWKKGDKNIEENDFDNYTLKEFKKWLKSPSENL